MARACSSMTCCCFFNPFSSNHVAERLQLP
jgi:hypothetical protein